MRTDRYRMAGAGRVFHMLFNLTSKRTVLCSSNFQLKRQLHLTRGLLIEERKYTKKHEWITIENGVGTTGITDYAAEQLGEVTYVQLPEVDLEVKEGDELCVLESVKAAADVFSPATGVVTEVNVKLEESPELVNESPYDKGWLVKLKLSESLPPELLSQEEYDKFLIDCQEEQ